MGLPSCGPQLRPPEVSTGQVLQERQNQQELALKLNMERTERLFRVSSAVRLQGSELCGDGVEPFVGAMWLVQEAFPDETVVAAARVFDLGRFVKVRYVLPGSPAEAAGLQAGDEVVSIGEHPLEAPQGWGKANSRIQRLKSALEDHGERPLSLVARRDGVDLAVSIDPVKACKTRIALVNDDSVNAFTDGKTISVTTGMMRFAAGDDEMAMLLGHELGHIMLGHVNKQRGNQLIGGFFGFLLDLGIAAAGVNTGGVFTRMGANTGALVYSQAFETEADYLGLYFTARSGFDISRAPDFFRKMGIEHPSAIKDGFLSTHPSTPERAAAMENAVGEIQTKLKQGHPLVPERKADSKTVNSQ